MHVDKSEEMKDLLQVYAQETTFGDKKYDDCKLKLMAQRHLEHIIYDSRERVSVSIHQDCGSDMKIPFLDRDTVGSE